FGEGKRIYGQFQVEKLIAHGRIVQNAMENYLRAGLPLKQYSGFATLADPIVQGIDEIDGMVVYDQSGQQLFIVTDRNKPNPKVPDPSDPIRQIKPNLEVETTDSHYQIMLPLRNRFEIVGTLVVTASTDVLQRRLQQSFAALFFATAGLSA